MIGFFRLTEEEVAVSCLRMQTQQLLAYGARFKSIYLAADKRR